MREMFGGVIEKMYLCITIKHVCCYTFGLHPNKTFRGEKHETDRRTIYQFADDKYVEIAKFTPTELKEYEDSLKAYRDVKNSIDTALEKGRVEGVIQVAKKLLESGMDVDTVMKMTDLSKSEIEKL